MEHLEGHHDGCNYLGTPGLICSKCGQTVPGHPPNRDVVERLFMVAEIAHYIAPEQPAKELQKIVRDAAEAIQILRDVLDCDKEKRCRVCHWPLAADRKDGCVPGDCSYRPPDGHPDLEKVRKRRAVMAGEMY